MMTIKIHNVETGEIVEREMTSAEVAQWETDKATIELKTQAAADAAIAKAALLEKLGITEDEAKLLLS